MPRVTSVVGNDEWSSELKWLCSANQDLPSDKSLNQPFVLENDLDRGLHELWPGVGIIAVLEVFETPWWRSR